MANITLALPDELHARMRKHSEIRWSDVVRKSIAQKVELLETMDKIARKSTLSKRDIEAIARSIKKDSFEELNAE